MSIKVMIIDGQAAFRSLVMHHVTTHWPDAIISAYDPIVAGRLPDEFSGAGNDIILLGSELGDVNPLETLALFRRVSGFPPVIFFGGPGDDPEKVKECGARGFFLRKKLPHNALVASLNEILRSEGRTAATGFLFVGSADQDNYPLIKGYRILKKLAISSHSAVYLAKKDSTDVSIVLKVLRHSPDFADGIGAFDRFLQEYTLIAELDHPNIVRIYDLGVGDNHAHIAMEYVAGGDLKQKIQQGIKTTDALRYIREIASAMARIHSVGILHRDLKPGNIMVRHDGSLALIDFGLAKRMRLDQEITGSGQIFGTPYYMSPEQGQGSKVDLRSDIYSLGIIFYEMLTGRKPYHAGDAMGIIYQHNEAPVPVLPFRFSQYQALLNLLLAKQPDNRLQSAEELLEWL
jgi:eukaryotic-like serine/threonine-protein kinase